MPKQPKPYTGKPRKDRFVAGPGDFKILTTPEEKTAAIQAYRKQQAEARKRIGK